MLNFNKINTFLVFLNFDDLIERYYYDDSNFRL